MPNFASELCKDLWNDLLDRAHPARRIRRELRTQWARPGEGDGYRADRLFELTRDGSHASCVDARTWIDLEGPALFAAMDTTRTPIGRQILFRRLRTYADDTDALAADYAISQRLRMQTALRERLQLALAPLEDDEHAHIADFVFGTGPMLPRFAGAVPLWGALCAIALLGTLLLGWPMWLWLLVLPINAVLIFRVLPHLLRESETMKACMRMLGVADALATCSTPDIPELQQLAAQTHRRARARRPLRWLRWMQRPPVVYASVWLTLACLAEPIAHLHALRHFDDLREVFADTFGQVGRIDAAIAVASFLAWRTHHCHPVPAPIGTLRIEAGCHPLLDQPVANDVDLNDRGALVTGSNMAGKTTFIKMVALNMMLGRTLGVCVATQAKLPPVAVMASIRGEHSVSSGMSHYQSEAQAIRDFIAASIEGPGPLLVIDELFRGTNTRERVALAQSVLEHLGARALVLVTTHDVELQSALHASYALFHFREDPAVDGFFDYRLRPGASLEHNAIRVLQRMQVPAPVISRALQLAAYTNATIPARSMDQPSPRYTHR